MDELNTRPIDPEKLKGTKTERNLHTALSGESQAYLRYKWFEIKARTDGFEEVARIFCETADNEKEHAEIWFRYLGGWSSTEDNLTPRLAASILSGRLCMPTLPRKREKRALSISPLSLTEWHR